MWFKQFQVFQLPGSLPALNELSLKLEELSFVPCLASMPQSAGWVPVCEDEHSPLMRTLNGCIMLCLQVEEKILPAAVVRQTLSETVKEIELSSNRKLRQKEKYSLKDDIVQSLLPRAFSKLTRIYAYLDTRHRWLIVGTANSKKTDQFFSIFKKSVTDEYQPFAFNQLSALMTNWLKNSHGTGSFSVEKACVLRDPRQENRIIRCQHQDLYASGIQSLIKDGCEVIQLALAWHDHLTFSLSHDFIVRQVQFQDAVIAQAKETEAESLQAQFDADFLLMTDIFAGLISALFDILNAKPSTSGAEGLMQKSA